MFSMNGFHVSASGAIQGHHGPLVPLCFQKSFTADRKNQGFFLERINPFPHNNTFWRPWETNLLKTLWEKEKLLATSNFSFAHHVFYLFG